MATLAEQLPNERSELLGAAAEALASMNRALQVSDEVTASKAADLYEAVIWKLNGGTFYGCLMGADAAGSVVIEHCAATPGNIPLWGQRGEFLIEVDGVRSLVKSRAGFGGALSVSFEFHAIDLDGPFVSETGFLSQFDSARFCRSVDEVAMSVFAARFYRNRQPTMIQADYQRELGEVPLPGWLRALTPRPRRKLLPGSLPSGYTLIDVVLPAHQAFIVRKWAELAELKLQKESEGET